MDRIEMNDVIKYWNSAFPFYFYYILCMWLTVVMISSYELSKKILQKTLSLS